MLFLCFLFIGQVTFTGCNIEQEDVEAVLGDSFDIPDLLKLTPNFVESDLGDTTQFEATGGTPPYEFCLRVGPGTLTAEGLYTAP